MKFRTRRSLHKEPTQQAQMEKPFFSKAADAAGQADAMPFFQAKLAIGRPGDKYEREADAVADRVVNNQGQTPVVQRQEISAVQRTSLAPEEEEPVQMQSMEEEEEPVQMQQDPLSPRLQRAVEEEPVQMQAMVEDEPVQMQAMEEEEPVQMQAMEEEEPVQMQHDPLSPRLQRAMEEEPVQMQSMEEEEPVQMQEMEEEEPVQMQSMEEEEPVQMQSMEEEEPLQMMEAPEEEELQTKMESGSAATASPRLSSRIQDKAGQGRPLPDKARTEMEQAFGTDFSGVNIHTDTESVQMNQELGAQAFTHGKDVYFNSGKYRPESAAGKLLLAHELTHVVQQGGGEKQNESGKKGAPGNSNIQNKTGTPLGRSVQKQKDGSGEHGAEEAGFSDRMKKQMWYRVASVAEGMGLANAGRHMRHYLNNTGDTLDVNVDSMLRDLPGFDARLQQEINEFKQIAGTKIGNGETAFNLSGRRKVYYAGKSESQDWFFALGGFTYWCTAKVTAHQEDGDIVVKMELTMHVFDRYNWDKGKSVTIAGVTVSDESLGRLHRVGLAKEYEVNGESSPKVIKWHFAGTEKPAEGATIEGMDYNRRQGERSDAQRERNEDIRQERGRRDTSDETRVGR